MEEFLISKGIPLVKYGIELELGNKYKILTDGNAEFFLPSDGMRIWVRITEVRSFGFYLEEDHELYYGKYFYTKSELRDFKLKNLGL